VDRQAVARCLKVQLGRGRPRAIDARLPQVDLEPVAIRRASRDEERLSDRHVGKLGADAWAGKERHGRGGSRLAERVEPGGDNNGARDCAAQETRGSHLHGALRDEAGDAGEHGYWPTLSVPTELTERTPSPVADATNE
jgi:hypothetical protein